MAAGAHVLTLNKRVTISVRRVNLVVGQLKAAIRELLRERGIEGSVTDKINSHGEIVVAVIMNERCPACGGTGKRVYATEEARRDGE